MTCQSDIPEWHQPKSPNAVSQIGIERCLPRWHFNVVFPSGPQGYIGGHAQPATTTRGLLASALGCALGRLPWQSLGISCKSLGILGQFSGAVLSDCLGKSCKALERSGPIPGAIVVRQPGDIVQNPWTILANPWGQSWTKSCKVFKGYWSFPRGDLGRLPSETLGDIVQSL